VKICTDYLIRCLKEVAANFMVLPPINGVRGKALYGNAMRQLKMSS